MVWLRYALTGLVPASAVDKSDDALECLELPSLLLFDVGVLDTVRFQSFPDRIAQKLMRKALVAGLAAFFLGTSVAWATDKPNKVEIPDPFDQVYATVGRWVIYKTDGKSGLTCTAVLPRGDNSGEALLAAFDKSMADPSGGPPVEGIFVLGLYSPNINVERNTEDKLPTVEVSDEQRITIYGLTPTVWNKNIDFLVDESASGSDEDADRSLIDLVTSSKSLRLKFSGGGEMHVDTAMAGEAIPVLQRCSKSVPAWSFEELRRLMASANAQESPLRCVFGKGAISCDVLADEISISDVVLNRGNCPSPIPSENERKDVEAYFGSLADKRAVLIAHMAAPTVAGSFSLACPESGSEADLKMCRIAPSIVRVDNDPAGTRKFGDRVVIPLQLCPNLVEYSIEVNGQIWTWQTGP
ncbi:hypothetical protein MesoLj131b_07910 [Mesorhizobium sp. 131-2-5]|uniref:hypothetical protein n=1 Tax=Mesorhizobium sp. 131-2-5 TaxID=2744519 RepID=UPI001926FB06|nr:hypothetical protein [Mesorhizobium sp. 131-2-5]BCG98791.1 hypothetical protein MesoLj131b_07910 [Mesorhizobium sp. 131-2-5]